MLRGNGRRLPDKGQFPKPFAKLLFAGRRAAQPQFCRLRGTLHPEAMRWSMEGTGFRFASRRTNGVPVMHGVASNYCLIGTVGAWCWWLPAARCASRLPCQPRQVRLPPSRDIEPDMKISRIRLSDKTSRLHPRHVVPKPAQAHEPEMMAHLLEAHFQIPAWLRLPS